jgi:uncharacterized protein (DUF608 family)
MSPTRSRKIYSGEALRAVAMPLGGLGTGSIALCGDGSLRQWQIHNQVNHLACVPHSFFAIWARRVRPSNEPVARVLQSSALYDTQGITPPPTANDHLVPPTHRSLLKQLRGVERTEFIGEYPIAELHYHDADLPLQITLEAFNPFIPLNAKDSGLPCLIFNFTLTNPNPHDMLASLAVTLQNAVGWDGLTPIFDTKCSVYGGNSNMLARVGDLTVIHKHTTRLPEDDDAYGTMALATLAPDATYLTQWNDVRVFWDDFSTDGRLSNLADSTPSVMGRTWNGALATPFTLAAGESHAVTFIVAWHFPNRYVNWTQNRFFGLADTRSKFWLGNQYNQWFRSALDVTTYAQANLARLTHETQLARDTFYDTTLPHALIDTVTSQMSIMRTPACFWTEDGRFYGFEGCNGASTADHTEPYGGCCPLNCTHVWNYEMALARLFPALERTMRETEWDAQQHPSGYLPHRVLLPLYLPRVWDRKLEGPANPALDGLLGAILKTYREYRACGDRTWLRRLWSSVKQAFHYIWTTHDPEHTGIILGEQPNTYDISIYGANTFIGTLYLAALHASALMAGWVEDDAFGSDCHETYQRGRVALERLWNGEYYIQEVDLEKYAEQNWATGCHADQLLGQWWAHNLGLGHVLPTAHIRAAAQSIFKYNFRENFHGHQQKPRVFVTDDDQGLLICTWPRDGRPAVPTLYSDEVWTGIEYAVAGLLLYEGITEPAVKMVEATRARYDGRKQNPWNDIECGDHYVRAMSSWSLLEAASGFRYDAGVGELAFAPRLTPDDYRAPFVTRDGWGTFTQQVSDGAQTATLTLAYGALQLHRFCLRSAHATPTVAVKVDGLMVNTMSVVDDGEVVITLLPVTTLQAGQLLEVTLR